MYGVGRGGEVLEKGQERFFTQLYLEQFDFLYHLACALLHDDHLGYDLVQDTFQAAFIKIDVLMRHPNPTGWLVQTMKNKAVHIYRDQKRLLELNEAMMPHADDLAFEEQESDWKERWLRVLSEEEISLLQKYYGSGYPIQDIAKEYKISVEACYKRLQRARKKLEKVTE